ncbi:MAG: PD40 domain-containing protein [Gammaproteobacteria bacterium]|nr:PD40 domain-containing protein [Gammaproteobacteria bacterium]
MKLIKFIIGLIIAFNASTVLALPTTDIAIFDLKALLSKDKKTVKPFHLTYRDGYDNQPKFSKDGQTIYFTRGITANGKSQTDIMAYDFESKQLTNISNSPDSSEYSPTPYQDGFLTIIGVADSNGKQYLNQLAIDSGAQKTFTTAIEPIGYHAWLNENEAAVFVLGDFMTLQVLHTDANRKPMVLAENIGRSFHRIAENKVSYTVEEVGKHRIYLLDGNHQSHDTGIVLPEGVQDYVWLNDKEVILGKDSKLYRKSAKSVSEIVDLSEFGIKGISRLAIDNNQLSVVYNRLF